MTIINFAIFLTWDLEVHTKGLTRASLKGRKGRGRKIIFKNFSVFQSPRVFFSEGEVLDAFLPIILPQKNGFPLILTKR